MADIQQNKKPRQPAPPLNAQKVAKPASDGKSVYDEIAERRRNERHKVGVTAPESRDEDVKVYKREKQVKKPAPVHISDEENFDVPIPPKSRKKLGLWTAVIVVLSAMCVAAGVAYCAVNGVFDGLIKML